ncbi:MAG: response regulator [Pyrinomonadaceae bacterium]
MQALVVDDKELIRSNVADLLRSDGWDVTEAASAERAFELLGADAWSLVCCAVRLSETNTDDGYAALRRSEEVQPAAQIVLKTGHVSAVGAPDAVHSGAYDYLPKPFELSQLEAGARTARTANVGARAAVGGALSGGLEHLSCVASGGVGDLRAGKHPRQLFDAARSVEFLNPDLRATAR